MANSTDGKLFESVLFVKMAITNISTVFLTIIILLTFFMCAENARILGVFPLSGKSLNILYNKLMKGLADAGHDVTVVSAYQNQLPLINGTYKDVVLTGFADDYESLIDALNSAGAPTTNPLYESATMFNIFLPIYNKTLHHPNMVTLLNSGIKFDLVIIEHLWSECLLALGAFYNCPVVAFASMGGINSWVYEMVGNPLPLSYVPHYWMLGDFSEGMSVTQKIRSVSYHIFDYFHSHYIQFPLHDEVIQSAFATLKHLKAEKLHHSVSLVLLGTHFSLHQPTPLVPNIKEIGGFHIDPPKKLPKELQSFLDEAKEGVVYFSMGSHVRSKDYLPGRREMFLEVFKELELKVLWKFDDETLADRVPNVLVKKWVPQADVLAHPNVKLFITHAGHGSTLETVYHGVPALMIPLFLDQFNNAHNSVARGFALQLSLSGGNFTKNTLLSVIKEMLNNPKYRQEAKEISKLFHDRPLKPMENAVYWIEYVIRHKGAKHMKVAGLGLSWYKYYLIDVILLLVISSVVLVFVIVCGVKLVLFKFTERNLKQKLQ